MRFNERIEIESLTKTKQPNGEVTTSWDTKAKMWCDILPMRAGEDYEGDKKTYTQRFKFRVRYRTDISREDRIIYDGQEFDIKSINKIYKEGTNKVTEIEGVTNG